MRVFDDAVASAVFPLNFAWKRTRLVGRFFQANVDRNSHVRVDTETRCVVIVLLPRLAMIDTVPPQPCEGETASGRVTLPVSPNAYGARRSRLGLSVSVTSLGEKRRT